MIWDGTDSKRLFGCMDVFWGVDLSVFGPDFVVEPFDPARNVIAAVEMTELIAPPEDENAVATTTTKLAFPADEAESSQPPTLPSVAAPAPIAIALAPTKLKTSKRPKFKVKAKARPRSSTSK
jgi:hypothetical protein